MTHTVPLLQSLQLEQLADQRRMQLLKLVISMIEGECHPAFYEVLLHMGAYRLTTTSYTPRLWRINGRRFCAIGLAIYNETK